MRFPDGFPKELEALITDPPVRGDDQIEIWLNKDKPFFLIDDLRKALEQLRLSPPIPAVYLHSIYRMMPESCHFGGLHELHDLSLDLHYAGGDPIELSRRSFELGLRALETEPDIVEDKDDEYANARGFYYMRFVPVHWSESAEHRKVFDGSTPQLIPQDLAERSLLAPSVDWNKQQQAHWACPMLYSSAEAQLVIKEIQARSIALILIGIQRFIVHPARMDFVDWEDGQIENRYQLLEEPFDKAVQSSLDAAKLDIINCTVLEPARLQTYFLLQFAPDEWTETEHERLRKAQGRDGYTASAVLATLLLGGLAVAVFMLNMLMKGCMQ